MLRTWSSLSSFWSSWRDTFGSKYDKSLPPELWVIIIEFVLDEARQPYFYCTPATFSRYQARFRSANGLESDTTLDDWKAIRLVCRTWRRLAGPQPHLNIKSVVLPESAIPEEEMNSISSILIHYGCDVGLVLQRNLGDPVVRANFTTLIFCDDQMGSGLNILLDNPSAFSNLRCLSLLSSGRRPSFWQALQDGYPQLVSLTLQNYISETTETYTFPHLEVLDMYAWGRFRLSCPSLKHFAVRDRSGDGVLEFLRTHGPQLESFFLEEPSLAAQTSNLRAQMWTMAPNVKLFGSDAYATQFPPPPSGHPLRHLRLFSRPQILNGDRVLGGTLRAFVQVTHLYVRPIDLDTLTMKHDFRQQCLKRDVKVVYVPNPRSALTLQRRSIPWMTKITLVFTYPCWFPWMVWFTLTRSLVTFTKGLGSSWRRRRLVIRYWAERLSQKE